MLSYVLWNNKGGVGKSFLTFALAAEYAKKFPAKKVCVIDMCPQANVSEILLGGNGVGHSLLNQELEQKESRKTVGGYFDERLSQPDQKTTNEVGYARETAKSLPNNLLLVVGDPSIELQVQSINQIASVDLPQDRWKNVHKWIVDLKDGIATKHNDITFFIDCNPSFSTYTAQSILAGDFIIVPCTADGSSARAIDNIGKMIYGKNIPDSYRKVSFSAKVKEFDLSLPNVKTVILNRYTTNKKRPSSAFLTMFKEIKKRAFDLGLQEKDFNQIPDAHTVAIVCSEKAIPISDVRPGPHDLKDGRTTINSESLDEYRKKVGELVDIL